MTSISAQVDFGQGLSEAWTNVVTFAPLLLAFLVIILVGYLVAKVLAKAVNSVLERVGFDRAVERGGVGRAMARSNYDPSDLLAKVAFYAVMLFVLQLAFGVFGPNPVSELLFSVIAFLPQVFVAIVIVVIAAAVAAAVKEVIQASLGGLSYGNALGNAASIAILAIGGFAALNQLEIAPAIINGLFYAILAVVAGSAIIAIGGGGVTPMRRKWEEALGRLEDEADAIRDEAEGSEDRVRARAEARKNEVRQEAAREPAPVGARETRPDAASEAGNGRTQRF
jgi:MFS family permease